MRLDFSGFLAVTNRGGHACNVSSSALVQSHGLPIAIGPFSGLCSFGHIEDEDSVFAAPKDTPWYGDSGQSQYCCHRDVQCDQYSQA